MTMVAAPCRENAIPQNSSSSADPMPVDTPANSVAAKPSTPGTLTANTANVPMAVNAAAPMMARFAV